MNILLCIPTYNPGKFAPLLLQAIRGQSIQPNQLLVVDSGSSDGTPDFFSAQGVEVRSIPLAEFNHGATRQLCVDVHPDADIVVFLTQDAILNENSALETLLARFADPHIGAAYGRQLPRPNAGPIEAHARVFNYPDTGALKSLADAPHLGIKTAFLSNSFAAYRRAALCEIGGFPGHVILGEDTWVGAKMLLAGWHIAYCAQATVLHSHDFGPLQEFRRYFDIGVFHGREAWLRREFGEPRGEGMRFIRSEWRFLAKMAPFLIPAAFLRTMLKFLGYKLGTSERLLPVSLKRHLSLHAGYWDSH
ncbi:MAG: glycosyltransferase family 2 protein [Sulfuricella sp.]|nr:glycosyltransferase family 2 protein [Sulfuricella sp.]